MSSIKTYKELIVWQKGILLVKEVYELTSVFPADEKFGLTSQIKRAAVSIPSNIAEGWGRKTTSSYMQFLRIARGSLFELETQIIISKELKIISDSEKIDLLILEISKMLNTLIGKLEVKVI